MSLFYIKDLYVSTYTYIPHRMEVALRPRGRPTTKTPEEIAAARKAYYSAYYQRNIDKLKETAHRSYLRRHARVVAARQVAVEAQ